MDGCLPQMSAPDQGKNKIKPMDGKLAVSDWTQCEAPCPSGVEGKTIRCREGGGDWRGLGFGASALLCSFYSRWLDQRERTADAQGRDNISLETWC